MEVFKPIVARTCEDAFSGQPPRPLVPKPDLPFAPFEVNDPFGLRCAIMPIFFVSKDGDFQGLGTGFSTDPWGSFCTADHVISDYRNGVPEKSCLALMFSYGKGYGRIGFKLFDTFGIITGAQSLVVPYDNPFSFLPGQTDTKQLDLAFLSVSPPQGPHLKTLPVKSKASFPAIGDIVVALGFPGIETEVGTSADVQNLITENMAAAYGKVVAVHIEGRDLANPTPVFEVEANWPSGMSGGPVFNAQGEVVGIVSRSIDQEPGNEVGLGWAILLGALPVLERWVPALDTDNASYRRCWITYCPAPWKFGAASPSKAEAETKAEQMGKGFQVSYGAWQVGTDNFMIVVKG